jgi:hypothetical protein
MVAFPIEWPKALYDMFSGMSALSAAGGQILSPDCLLNGGASSIANMLGSKLYVQGVAVGLVPLVSILFIIAFWRSYSCFARAWRGTLRFCVSTCCNKRCGDCCRKRESLVGSAPLVSLTPKQVRQNSRVAIVMLLFMTHLMLVQTALDFFVCRRETYKPTPANNSRYRDAIFPKSVKLVTKEVAALDGLRNTTLGIFMTTPARLKQALHNTSTQCVARRQYLEADPLITCWAGTHTVWASGLGGPMLLIYGIGIPLGAWGILAWRRKKLDEDRCREVYGFMYSNFKLDYYFWDVLIYARKVCY